MSTKLPSYVEARPGDPPDAFLLDGDRTVPLRQVERSPDSSASLAEPQLPADFADTARTIAAVSRAHADVGGLWIVGAPGVVMGAVDEGLLEMQKREAAKHKVSASS